MLPRYPSYLQCAFLIRGMDKRDPEWIEYEMDNTCSMNIKDRQTIFKEMYKRWPKHKFDPTRKGVENYKSNGHNNS